MTQKEWLSYLGGFFDGEGSISLARRIDQPNAGYRLICSVSQKDPIPLKGFQVLFGGAIRCKKYKHYICHDWRLCNRKALAFLKIIEPYLIVKAPQARLAIQFQNRRLLGGVNKKRVKDYLVIDEAEAILMKKLNHSRFRGFQGV